MFDGQENKTISWWKQAQGIEHKSIQFKISFFYMTGSHRMVVIKAE